MPHFALARDSSNGIGTVMKTLQKTAMARRKKHKQRIKQTNKPRKESNESGCVRKSMVLKQAKPETEL